MGYNAKQKGDNRTKTGTLVGKKRNGPMQSQRKTAS